MSTFILDWKAQRAAITKSAAATAVDKEALEKAFMDQSYGHVCNRAGDLFQDPHRLGFEIVFTNEANTRMVGLFAFRLKDRLLYAPVFFLSGEIKGYDLAYRQWVKKFCPLTPEWTRFLLDNVTPSVGTSVDREQVGTINSQVHLERLARPPQYQKAASSEADLVAFARECMEKDAAAGGMKLSNSAEWRAEWGKIAEALDTMSDGPLKPEPVLNDFFKNASDAALDRMAMLLDAVPAEVVDALVKNAGEEAFVFERTAKEASTPVEPTLAVKTASAPDEESHAHLCEHGYFMIDKRAADKVTDVVEEIGHVATGIPGPGVYKMLMQGGEFRKVFAAPFNADADLRMANNCGSDGCPKSLGYMPEPDGQIVVIDLASKDSKRWDHASSVLVVDDAKDAPEEKGSETPTAGKFYRVFCPDSGILSSPFKVDSIEKGSDGVKLIRCYDWNPTGNPWTITHNPDARQGRLQDNLVNSGARFFEVSHELQGDKPHQYFGFVDTNATPGAISEFNNWIMEAGGKKMTVKKSAHGFTVTAGKVQWQDLYRKEAHTLLAAMGINVKTAGAWLDNPGGRWVFPKTAYATQVMRQPDFRTDRDGVFGIEVEQPYNEELPTETQQPQHPDPRIGDAHDPSMGNGPTTRGEALPRDLVLSSAPEMLAQMARQMHIPHVMEHGAIGSLSRTYDSLQLVESYIPPMEECLDRLGRCLFLYYWKPQDFEKAYGTDDMADQENDFLNAFRMLGDLVLGLLRRSRSGVKSQGSPVQ